MRALVLKLAAENAGWGYTRILGELRKLGTAKISRTTVINILREKKLDPKTDPAKGTWGEFLRSHGQTLWQCDFFSKHVITAEGVRQCFVLAFLHVASRRAYLSPCTFTPTPQWMAGQARAFLADAKAKGLEAGVVPLASLSVHRDSQRQALLEARQLIADAQALRQGTGVFAALSLTERNEHLAALGLPPDAVPVLRYPGFLTMSDDALIDIVSAGDAGEPLPLGGHECRDEVLAEASAELARRLGTWESSLNLLGCRPCHIHHGKTNTTPRPPSRSSKTSPAAFSRRPSRKRISYAPRSGTKNGNNDTSPCNRRKAPWHGLSIA